VRRIAVAKCSQSRHVGHPGADDRIRFVLDEVFELDARCLGLTIEQLAERPVAASFPQLIPGRMDAEVACEAARALSPVTVQHA
jgi:hypothetical protein